MGEVALYAFHGQGHLSHEEPSPPEVNARWSVQGLPEIKDIHRPRTLR